MNWYSGSIAEAVQIARQRGAVFFVAVLGEDEPSKKLEEAVASNEIQQILSKNQYICIRLQSGSTEHQQFKQIYSNAHGPCLYYISLMGTPVEIVNGEVAVSDLKGICESAWSKHSKVLEAQRPVPQPEPPTSTAQHSEQSALPGPTPTDSVPAAGPSTGITGQVGEGSDHRTSANAESLDLEEDASNENITLDQKIERARQLAAARAKLKVEEEAEEARKREKERREAGKGMAELKRWQDEQEAKRLVEERKREKMEDQLLRQKLREQIAQDRAERNRRTNASLCYEGEDPSASTSSASKPSIAPSAPVNYTGKARLQFRMPDGSSHSSAFEQELTLGHVRQFVKDELQVKFNFSLCVAFPRREYSASEYSKSLKELGLVPSATLLVIPEGGRILNPVSGTGGSGIWGLLTSLLGYLLYPVTFLFSMIQRALPSSGGEPSNQQSPASAAASNRKLPPGVSSPPKENKSAEGGQGQGEPSTSKDLRKRNVDRRSGGGNIHRLRNQESDSDDELGTWNGNSTQQKPH